MNRRSDDSCTTSTSKCNVKCLTSSSLPLWEDFDKNKTKRRRVLFFWAPWHDQCKVGGPMDTIFESLAEATTTTKGNNHGDDDAVVEFWKIEAEEYPQLCQQYTVTYIPTFLMVDTNGAVVDRVEGSNDPARLTMAVRSFVVQQPAPVQHQQQQQPSTAEANPSRSTTTTTSTTQPPTTATDLEALTQRSPVMLFMKGLPSQPRCGFSRQMCNLLDRYDITYDAYDILTNEEVRQGLKEFSDWPTYPQLYIQGEFIGGLDICKELDESGELEKLLSSLK
jgi:Grx4 family monothiol glutaredoxin